MDNYKWCKMPPTVHKILVHGIDIIKHFQIPIGILSEDALEARHKEFRLFRLNNTRKSSRINANRDLLKHLILTSEPLIGIHRQKTTKKNDITSDLMPYLILHEDADSNYANLKSLDLDKSILEETSSSSESDS